VSRLIGARLVVPRAARRFQTLAIWLPCVLAAAYAVAFVVKFPLLVERVYWDSDAAMFAVAARTASGSSVFALAHYASYTAVWFTEATRWLPFYRQLWEVAPYLFCIGGVGLLAWGSWRLAGGWAAAMTAIAGAVSSPFVNYDRVTLFLHTPACVCGVVLAAFSLWLAEGRSALRTVPAALLVGVLAGATLASDPLFWVVGFIPFVATGLAFAVTRRWWSVVVVSGCSALALVAAGITRSVMTPSRVVVSLKAQLQLAPAADLVPNLERAVGLVVREANGNYSIAGWTTPSVSPGYVLSVVCGALVLIGLAAPFLLVVRELRAPVRSVACIVWATFWATCVAANTVSYAITVIGTQTGYYLMAVIAGEVATAPILLAGSRRLRVGGGIAISILALANLVSVLDNAQLQGSPLRLASLASRIVAIAKREDALYGYADYWDSSDLTWATNLRIQVSPVFPCGASDLCAFQFNVLSSWFQPHATRSFVLRDSKSLFMHSPPPAVLGKPAAVFRLDGQFTMYVYPYDVATRIDDDATVWALSLHYGSGFNRPEQLQGTTSRWMIQDGKLDVRTGLETRVSLSAQAFSNAGPRELELLGARGRVLGSVRVQTYAGIARFGPFDIPPGTTILTLVARPGPRLLGATDLRNASVFLGPISVSSQPVPASGSSP
jgi:hypothetical protein